MNLTGYRSILMLLILSGLLSACSREPSPEKMQRGDQLYGYYCRECHLHRGIGAEFEHLPVGVSQLQVHDLVLIIKHGYQLGHPMGHFPNLSHEQALTVAEYAVALRQQQRQATLPAQSTKP
ncbi:c-type cytochrome [Nitrincola tapanii]|nr:hypothetical protein [Nitrincola tapanii]